MARQVLAALDAQCWTEVAALLHPEIAERFRLQMVELCRVEEGWPKVPADADTQFPGPMAVLGVHSVAEAEALTASELFDRLAEAMLRNAMWPGESPPRITRVLLGVESSGAEATARYRVDVREGKLAVTFPEETPAVSTLVMERTSAGWSVRDVDPNPLGGRHLLLSEAQMSTLKGESAI
jgi:hypothetical protein